MQALFRVSPGDTDSRWIQIRDISPNRLPVFFEYGRASMAKPSYSPSHSSSGLDFDTF